MDGTFLGMRNWCFQIKLMGMVLLMIVPAAAPAWASSADDIAAIKTQKDDAIFKVQDIVNQPITHLKFSPGMVGVAHFDVWFHPGAITPDFDHVDIRKTQALDYQSYQYVTSDANPGEVFLGGELEFNSMTKYFYTDRSIPKKKLTEAEMLQINDLYRVIGHCNEKLDELEHPDPPLSRIHAWITTHKPAVAAMAGALLVALIFIRKRRATKYED
jgi:hypothetical protein